MPYKRVTFSPQNSRKIRDPHLLRTPRPNRILISSRSRVSTDEETNGEKWGVKGWKVPAVGLLPLTFAKSRA